MSFLVHVENPNLTFSTAWPGDAWKNKGRSSTCSCINQHEINLTTEAACVFHTQVSMSKMPLKLLVPVQTTNYFVFTMSISQLQKVSPANNAFYPTLPHANFSTRSQSFSKQSYKTVVLMNYSLLGCWFFFNLTPEIITEKKVCIWSQTES